MRRYLLLAVLLGFAAALPLVIDGRFALDLLITIAIFATFATAWNIAGGMTGLFSLGHSALFAIGAYGVALLFTRFHIPVLLAAALSAVAAAAAALLIGAMSARLRGHFFALATLALGMTIYLLLGNLGDITGADEGITIPFAPDAPNLIFAGKLPYWYLALGLYALTALTAITIYQGRLGHRMRAVREDEITAHAIGVQVVKTKLTALAVSGAFSALAGSLYAIYTLYVTPTNSASIDVALSPALMAIIGGMSSVFGPAIGAVIVTVLNQQVITAIGAAVPGLSNLVYGGMLIGAILLAPTGVAGACRMLLRRFSGRAADPLAVTARHAVEREPVRSPPCARSAVTGGAGLVVDNVAVCRGGLQILDGLTLTAQAEEITSIIGPNGAGKTTLFNVISGFMTSDSGTVSFAGRQLTGRTPAALARDGVARTFQSGRGLRGLSVAENVLVAAMNRFSIRPARAFTAELLAEWELGDYSHTDVGVLPDGVAKRLEVARALATGPSLLLLDEVLAGLDPSETDRMLNLVRQLPERGITVVLIEHHIQAVLAVSDRVVVIDRGRTLASGSPDQIAQNPAVIAAYLGTEVGNATT